MDRSPILQSLSAIHRGHPPGSAVQRYTPQHPHDHSERPAQITAFGGFTRLHHTLDVLCLSVLREQCHGTNIARLVWPGPPQQDDESLGAQLLRIRDAQGRPLPDERLLPHVRRLDCCRVVHRRRWHTSWVLDPQRSAVMSALCSRRRGFARLGGIRRWPVDQLLSPKYSALRWLGCFPSMIARAALTRP